VKVDREAVLNMWAMGLPSKVIAEALDLSDSAYARCVVRRARRRGDPRAVRRIGTPLDLEPHLIAAVANAAKDQRTTPAVILREAVTSYLGIG
jgi:hypothetical protein